MVLKSVCGGYMVKRQIKKDLVKKEPYRVWNEFVDILANEELGNLNDVQAVAYLCFWYDSEVQNGGHFQYFENTGIKQAEKTIPALLSLGAEEQSKVLKKAAEKLNSERSKISSVNEFAEKALEGNFDEQDNAYHKCSPTVIELLQRYLTDKQDNFVEII